jgi:hypothetical protein
MKTIFNDRYSLFILKKDFTTKDGTLLRKGWSLAGGCISGLRISNDNNSITMRDKTNEIFYQGINHVDCAYRRFSLHVFFRFIQSAKEDRRRKKFRHYLENLK